VPYAEAALAEVEARGPRSVNVREIVLRLARDLGKHASGNFLKMGFQPGPQRELSWRVQRIQ
jgi:hypothetical protein